MIFNCSSGTELACEVIVEEVISQVAGAIPMENFEYQDSNFELDSVFNTEALHRAEHQNDVLTVACDVKQVGCNVLYQLKLFRVYGFIPVYNKL